MDGAGRRTPAADGRERARVRAERYLAGSFLRPHDVPRNLPPGLDRSLVEAQRMSTLRCTLAAYEDLGLIDTDEASRWRAFAERPITPAELPAVSSPAALELLARLWRELEQGRPGDAGTAERATRRISAAIMAGSSGGVLSVEDARGWQARLEDRRAAGDVDAARLLAAMRSTRLDEVRLVVPGPARRESGLVVTSAEVFADGVIVHWRRPIMVTFSSDGRPNVPDTPQMALRDDCGTDYVMFGGGGGWSGGPGTNDQHGSSSFAPAPPAEATELRATVGDDEFSIGLGAGSHIE